MADDERPATVALAKEQTTNNSDVATSVVEGKVAAPADTAAPVTATAIAAALVPPHANLASVATDDGLALGISEIMILAPVPPPPQNKRKAHGEFTVSQKLAILAELRGPDAPSVNALAARHRTSRTSIYRWKKEQPRLRKLETLKGGAKRAARSRRPRFTVAERLAAVRDLRGADPPSARAVAARRGLTGHRSLYRWARDEERLARLVERDCRAGCRRAGTDPLRRVKAALRRWGGATPAARPTGTAVAAKARRLRDDMLAQHARTPFLTNEEVKGMREFTASSSWGRKFGRELAGDHGGENDCKVAAASAAADAFANKTHSLDTADAAALPLPDTMVGAASAAPENACPAAPAANSKAAAAMRREILSLKRKLAGAELRAKDLEAKNTGLRNRLATLEKETIEKVTAGVNGEGRTMSLPLSGGFNTSTPVLAYQTTNVSPLSGTLSQSRT